MEVAIVTGAAGLVGSEAVRFFANQNMTVIGIDNDMRRFFFGEEASTEWNRNKLKKEVPGYIHFDTDIRNAQEIEAIFSEYGKDIRLVLHAAAQPSHDWAAREPFTDFTINANGTLNLLEMTRKFCPEAVFIFTSTNKVYGDTPNRLPLIEEADRWELDPSHPYSANGIDETMSIDQTCHSLFGASKAAADLLVQEYGRYFGIKSAVFRGGCLTGPAHSGTELHGFLAYLMKCAVTETPYTIFGYKGKQVRDNIHSHDLIQAFWHFYQHPRRGEVYNIGGSRRSNCSIIEAIQKAEAVTGKHFKYRYVDQNRIGDHVWWISDISKFKRHYPEWNITYSVDDIMIQLYEAVKRRIS